MKLGICILLVNRGLIRMRNVFSFLCVQLFVMYQKDKRMFVLKNFNRFILYLNHKYSIFSL